MVSFMVGSAMWDEEGVPDTVEICKELFNNSESPFKKVALVL